MANKRILFSIVLGYIIAALALWGLFILQIRRISDAYQPVVNRLVPIINSKPMKQEIYSSFDGLTSVEVFLKNRIILNNQPLVFSLWHKSEKLREIPANGSNVGDGENVRFQFSPLTDSANRSYTLVLEANQTTTQNVPIEVCISNDDTYLNGKVDGEPGDISFQTYYRPQNRAQVMKSLAGEFIHKINRQFIVLVSIVSVLWLLATNKPRPGIIS